MNVRQLYRWTILFAAAGIVWQVIAGGPRSGIAFLLGALGSLANLWVFEWLTNVLERAAVQTPEAEPERKRPWGAGLFIGRYAALWLVGYTTVKALGVSPLPVLLGLLTSTAAVLAASIAELFGSLFKK